MEATKVLFGIYLFLAVYCTGMMSVLQLQHFALYPHVGKESFKEYLQANNKAAVLPAILPAVLLTLITTSLLFSRPVFMPKQFVVVSLVLNIVNLASTFIWQGRLHAQLARVGYNEVLIHQLIVTNWIRTIALFMQGLVAVYCATSAIN